MKYTGIVNDDRRITEELHAMGAFNQAEHDDISSVAHTMEAIGNFITWMRWKGEVGVYGCRVGVTYTRKQEITHLA